MNFTLNGVGLGVSGLDLVIPLPPILNVPLPTTALRSLAAGTTSGAA